MLNQGKKYAWQDYSRVISELSDEERFIPNQQQFQELKVIKQAPVQGLLEMFRFLWTGKK